MDPKHQRQVLGLTLPFLRARPIVLDLFSHFPGSQRSVERKLQISWEGERKGKDEEKGVHGGGEEGKRKE